jgi:hypothetical protein
MHTLHPLLSPSNFLLPQIGTLVQILNEFFKLKVAPPPPQSATGDAQIVVIILDLLLIFSLKKTKNQPQRGHAPEKKLFPNFYLYDLGAHSKCWNPLKTSSGI